MRGKIERATPVFLMIEGGHAPYTMIYVGNLQNLTGKCKSLPVFHPPDENHSPVKVKAMKWRVTSSQAM
jgi:hypothetical protein